MGTVVHITDQTLELSSVKWDKAYNTATVYQTNSATYATNTALNAASSILLPTSVFQNISSSFASNTFVNSNFLNLTGGTVNGSLSVNGFFQVKGTNATVISFYQQTANIPMNIVLADEGLEAGYPAPLGSIGVDPGGLKVRYGNDLAGEEWGSILYLDKLDDGKITRDKLGLGTIATLPSSTFVQKGSITSSDLTVTGPVLLGKTTTGSGAIQQISINTPLTFTGNSLQLSPNVFAPYNTFTTVQNNSGNWQRTYTTVQNNSATNWNYQGTDLKALTGKYEDTRTTVQSNSATNWNYQGTDLKNLSGNWQKTYTTVQSNSANWQTAYNYSTVFSVASSNYTSFNYINNNFLNLSGGTIDGTVAINGNFFVTGTASYINVVDFQIKDPLIYLGTQNPADVLDLGIIGVYRPIGDPVEHRHTGLIRNHQNKKWILFSGLSACPLSGTGPNPELDNPSIVIDTLKANLEGNLTTDTIVSGDLTVNGIVYTQNSNSTNWQSTYASVCSLSALWSLPSTDLIAVANYLSTNNIVMQSVSAINLSGTFYGDGSNLTGLTFPSQQSVNTIVQSNSANWNSVYTTVQSNSSTTWNYQGTDLKALTGKYERTFTTVQSNSATNWNYQGTDIKALTGKYERTFTTVQSNSSNWNTAYNTATTYSNVSGTFATKNFVDNKFLPLSGGTLTGQLNGTTIKLTDTTFTGKTVQAISLTGTNLFLEIEVGGGIKKYLQLFDIEQPLTTYFVDFEDGVKGSYASGNVTLNGLSWNLTESLIGTIAADFKNGLRSARLRGYSSTSMSMLQDKQNGIGTITFLYSRYGTDAQVQWIVEYSMNGGVTWIPTGTFTADGTVQQFTAVIDQPGNGRIRIRHNSGGDLSTNRRANIDDILITGAIA